MKSIRRYLVIILLAAITLVNFLAAVQGYRAGMTQAEQYFDQQLENIADAIAQLDTVEKKSILTLTTDTVVYQIWSSAGMLLASNLDETSAIVGFEAGFNFANFNRSRWRTFCRSDSDNSRWIIVAHRTDDQYAIADSIIVESILPIALGLPIVGLIVWLIVGSGLSPLHRLAMQLQSKQVEDLSPVKLASSPQELEPVVQSTNHLLQRLSDVVKREKRFASDAAHELRTPISILKIHLHNLEHEHPEICEKTEDFKLGLDRLEHLVDQILALYRCSPDQYIAKFEAVDLLKSAQEVIAQQYESIEKRHQAIELIGNSVIIKAYPFAINTLIQNLLSNASKYSPEHSEIRFTIGVEETSPFILVEDSGPGIAEEKYNQVYERFYRETGAREIENIAGSGLGLAIVSNIVHQHGAKIELGKSSFSSGLAVKVIFSGLIQDETGIS